MIFCGKEHRLRWIRYFWFVTKTRRKVTVPNERKHTDKRNGKRDFVIYSLFRPKFFHIQFFLYTPFWFKYVSCNLGHRKHFRSVKCTALLLSCMCCIVGHIRVEGPVFSLYASSSASNKASKQASSCSWSHLKQ